MTDSNFMAQALAQARGALRAGEVPVGAVVVRAGQVLAVGSNAPIGRHDPSAHAEIIALRAAARLMQNYRLDECELFVTLEPCAMCTGAMLHARLKRVVFGASDPKTGAAGSVLDLFANKLLNHRTQVQGGVLADECADLLQEFFQQKRVTKRVRGDRLREDALRTPVGRFEKLPDFPWSPHYLSDLPTLSGLRLHYLDEGVADAELSYLCLHGNGTWGFVFRNVVAELLSAGHRVVVPDLIGSGKSDKPKKKTMLTIEWHLQVLRELVDRLDLKNIVLLTQEGAGALAEALVKTASERCTGQIVNLPVSATELSNTAYQAPFPDPAHRAALRSKLTARPQTGLDCS